MSTRKTKRCGGRHSTLLTADKRDALQRAWHAVKSGEINMYKAAKQFNVNKTTLFKWCKKDNLTGQFKVGRPTFYSEDKYNQAIDKIRNKKMSIPEAAAHFDVSRTMLGRRLRKLKATGGDNGTIIAKSDPDEDTSTVDDGSDTEQSEETHNIHESHDGNVVENRAQYKVPSPQAFIHRRAYHFANREEDESIKQWFDRIQACVKLCEFDIYEDILVIDKFLAGLDDSVLQRYRHKPSLTMDDFMELLWSDHSFSDDPLFEIVKVESVDVSTDESTESMQEALNVPEIVSVSVSDILLESNVHIKAEEPITIIDVTHLTPTSEQKSAKKLESQSKSQPIYKSRIISMKKVHTESHIAKDDCVTNRTIVTGYKIEDGRYICIECGKSYSTKACFSMHYRRHNEAQLYSCKYCEKKFPSKTGLGKHIMRHERDQRCLECYLCGERCQRFVSLRIHFAVHHCIRRDKRLQCNVCQTYFYRQKSLDEHMRIHESLAERFKCSHCDRVFNQRHNLAAHMKFVHGNQQFICELCGKTYRSSNTLKKHSISHSDTRNFPCTICELRFKTNAQLRNHSTVHSSETPFQCDQCDTKFRSKALLSMHVDRRHNDSKKFECETCQKRFHTKNDRKSHMVTHTGERPYKCDYCDKRFTQRAPAFAHARKVHGLELSSRKYRGALTRSE